MKLQFYNKYISFTLVVRDADRWGMEDGNTVKPLIPVNVNMICISVGRFIKKGGDEQ